MSSRPFWVDYIPQDEYDRGNHAIQSLRALAAQHTPQEIARLVRSGDFRDAIVSAGIGESAAESLTVLQREFDEAVRLTSSAHRGDLNDRDVLNRFLGRTGWMTHLRDNYVSYHTYFRMGDRQTSIAYITTLVPPADYDGGIEAVDEKKQPEVKIERQRMFMSPTEQRRTRELEVRAASPTGRRGFPVGRHRRSEHSDFKATGRTAIRLLQAQDALPQYIPSQVVSALNKLRGEILRILSLMPELRIRARENPSEADWYRQYLSWVEYLNTEHAAYFYVFYDPVGAYSDIDMNALIDDERDLWNEQEQAMLDAQGEAQAESEPEEEQQDDNRAVRPRRRRPRTWQDDHKVKRLKSMR